VGPQPGNLLDRFLARPLLLALADSSTTTLPPPAGSASGSSAQRTVDFAEAGPESAPTTAVPDPDPLPTGVPDGPPLTREEATARFVRWLGDHGHRPPDGTAEFIAEAQARPDLVYHLAHGEVGVFVRREAPETDGRDRADDGTTGERAVDRLAALGWTVIEIGDEDEWESQVAQLPSVFGPVAAR